MRQTIRVTFAAHPTSDLFGSKALTVYMSAIICLPILDVDYHLIFTLDDKAGDRCGTNFPTNSAAFMFVPRP